MNNPNLNNISTPRQPEINMVDLARNILAAQAAAVTRAQALAGYRRLEVGEIKQVGDMKRIVGLNYGPWPAVGVGGSVDDDGIHEFYRPIPQEPAPNWMADSRPLLAEIAALSKQRDALVSLLRESLPYIGTVAMDAFSHRGPGAQALHDKISAVLAPEVTK